MKKSKTLIATFFVIIVNIFYSQEMNDSINLDSKPDIILNTPENSVSITEDLNTQPFSSETIKDDTTLLKKVDNLEAKLDKLIQVIKEDKDTTLKIGVLSLKKNQYFIYKTQYKENKTTKYIIDSSVIKKVRITILNGSIDEIYVYTENEMVFSNPSAPIDIDRVNKGKDKLFYKDSLSHNVILNSFLMYEKLEKGFPNDVSFELNDTTSKDIYQSTGINSLINIRLFSDVLGLIGQESNGLAQTEVDLSVPIHRKNFPNQYMYLCSDFKIKAQLSRLDEKYQVTKVNLIDSSFSRIDYNQRKWFNIELGINVISILTKKSLNKISLDLISGLNVSKFGGLSDTNNYALPFLGGNLELLLKSSKNMGIKASAKLYCEYFTEKQHEKFGENQWYFAPQLEVFYNPLGKPGNKIFSRINYMTLTKTSGAYWNFQFGYNISISELINNKVQK